MYSELRDLSKRKFGSDGMDILHDLIAEHGENWDKIKVLILTQKHLKIDYETLEYSQKKEYGRLNTPKTCYICKEMKRPNEFYVINRKRGKDLQECCRECSIKRVRKYYEENTEKRKAYGVRYYAENREEIRRLYALKMKLTNGYQKRYQKLKKDPEKLEKQKAYNKEWRAKNKDKTKAYKQRYQAKLKADRE